MLRHHCSPAVSTSTGVLTLLLLQGVFVRGEEINMSAEVGGSAVLQSGYQREDVGDVEWNFNDGLIAELSKKGDNFDFKSQFRGRLELIPGNVSLKVDSLTKEDSGQFQCIIAGKDGTQLTTKIFKLQVYDSTLTVRIRKNMTLHQLNNTCTVNLLCNASGPPDINISWSGFHTGHDARLSFSISPADGSVTLKCTASKGTNHGESDVTVKCDNKTLNNSGEPDVDSPTTVTDWPAVISVSCGGGLVLVACIVAGVCCHRRCKPKADPSEPNTVYADIAPNRDKNIESPTSLPTEMSIYETVDERAVGIQNKPQTLYDKVNFSRQGVKKEVGATLSSPYQDVL